MTTAFWPSIARKVTTTTFLPLYFSSSLLSSSSRVLMNVACSFGGCVIRVSVEPKSNGLDSANRRLDKPERYASKRFRWEFTTFRSRCRPVFVGQFFWRRVSSPRSSRGAARLSQTPTVGSGCHEGRRRVEEENARKYDADEEAHLSVPSDEPVWLSKLVNLVNPRRILRVFVRVFPAHAWCYYWRWYRV